MAESRRILVIIDPTSEIQPAAERAIWLAGELGATIEFFACVYEQHLAGERFYKFESLRTAREALIARHFRRLKELARSYESRGVAMSVDARWDNPLDEGITRKVEEVDPFLIVKDAHYHAAIERSIVSNTDRKLILNCPAPLLLVKSRALAEHPRVIAAVDPVHSHDKLADLDREILSHAEELCEAAAGELHVFHAFDPSPAIAQAAITMVTPISVPVSQVTDRLEQRHRQALDELIAGSRVRDFELHVHQGAPYQLLIALAVQIEADLVVMGAVSRSSLKQAFIGSTAERVLDHLPCDLLIVKSD